MGHYLKSKYLLVKYVQTWVLILSISENTLFTDFVFIIVVLV